MPNYVYKCTSCGQVVEIFHSFSEKPTDCELCGVEGSLERDYSTPFNYSGSKRPTKATPGQVVKEYIEQTREEVKEEKQRMKKEKFYE